MVIFDWFQCVSLNCGVIFDLWISSIFQYSNILVIISILLITLEDLKHASPSSQYIMIFSDAFLLFSNYLDFFWQAFNIFRYRNHLFMTNASVFHSGQGPFETRYQLLPRVIMYVITCFTIFLWYFCVTWKCYYLSSLLDVLLHALPFIFSGTSTYLYHFWRVSRRYSQHYFKKYTNISFK